MTTHEIAQRYVALCQQGKNEVCLDELFADDAVSIEAADFPGMDRATKGLDAIRSKNESWAQNHTVHRADVTGPFPNDNRFAVRFSYDTTDKQSGKRTNLDEIGLFTIENGKITREEFFYPSGN